MGTYGKLKDWANLRQDLAIRVGMGMVIIALLSGLVYLYRESEKFKNGRQAQCDERVKELEKVNRELTNKMMFDAVNTLRLVDSLKSISHEN